MNTPLQMLVVMLAAWMNEQQRAVNAYLKEELRGISGQDEYSDGMVEHDMHIGKFLDLLGRSRSPARCSRAMPMPSATTAAHTPRW